MAALPLPVRLVCLAVAALSAPAPGRIPKVYNALITSNQNLEPSKAFPVYQPVLHDTFAYPFPPAAFYGDYPLTGGLLPAAVLHPKVPSVAQQPPASLTPVGGAAVNKVAIAAEAAAAAAAAAAPAAPPVAAAAPAPAVPLPQANPPASPEDGSDGKPTLAPPLPPNTQSPIPLNEFGLPPQVLPLGRIDPAYHGFTQVGPFTYSYPNYRFYDPYDPFSFSPYAISPLYRPLSNVLEQGLPAAVAAKASAAAAAAAKASAGAPGPVGPSPALRQEPSDLNVLNYASKDPAIPNVPPPPLPDGGLKSDNNE